MSQTLSRRMKSDSTVAPTLIPNLMDTSRWTISWQPPYIGDNIIVVGNIMSTQVKTCMPVDDFETITVRKVNNV